MVKSRAPFTGDSSAYLGGDFRLSEIPTHGQETSPAYRRQQRTVRRRVPFIGESNAWLGGESSWQHIVRRRVPLAKHGQEASPLSNTWLRDEFPYQHMVRRRVPLATRSQEASPLSNTWLGGESLLSMIATHGQEASPVNRRYQRMVRRRVPLIGDINAWLGGESR